MTVHWHDDELGWCPCDEDEPMSEDVIILPRHKMREWIDRIREGEWYEVADEISSALEESVME